MRKLLPLSFLLLNEPLSFLLMSPYRSSWPLTRRRHPFPTQPHEKLQQVVAAEVIEGNFQIKF